MNQKEFANIILVVVIVLLLGVVGYFVFVKKSEPVAQQPTPTPISGSTNKTYTDSSYKFSVQYPSTFSIKTNAENGFILPEQTYNYLDRHNVDIAFISKLDIPKNSGIYRADVLISTNDAGYNGGYSFSAVDKSQGVPPPIIETLNLEKTVSINGITWGLARKTGATAGTRSNINVYHTYQNGIWYEVQTILWSQTVMVNGSAPDISKVEQELQNILYSFKFTK